MARGDTIFYSFEDWPGRIIRWATHGPFAHCAIDLGDGTAISTAPAGGVQTFPVGTSDLVRIGTASRLHPDAMEAAFRWFFAQKKQPYDWLDIMFTGYHLLWPRLPVPYAPYGFICSQCCGMFLEFAGFPFVGNRTLAEWQTTSPNDLYHLVMEVLQSRMTSQIR